MKKVCARCGSTFLRPKGWSTPVWASVKCCSRACAAQLRISHGETAGRVTTEFRIWANMNHRCTNESLPDYRHYGGRGITVCERWRSSLANFLADMGRRPSSRHTLDRIDNDGNYEPGNCRWATQTEQVRNQRNSIHVVINGSRMHLAAAAEHFGLKYATALYRHRMGIPFDRKLWAKS